MRRIPDKLKAEMAGDRFYKRCAVTGRSDEKIEWHHNLIFAGRQVNEKFCIIPLAKTVHDSIEKYREIVDWIMLNRASPEELKRYSRAVNLISKKAYLNKKYGVWDSKKIRYIQGGEL